MTIVQRHFVPLWLSGKGPIVLLPNQSPASLGYFFGVFFGKVLVVFTRIILRLKIKFVASQLFALLPA